MNFFLISWLWNDFSSFLDSEFIISPLISWLSSPPHPDVAIGAPWEDDGAVYIYLGSASGLRQTHSQKLQPQDFPQTMKGFGMGLSRGIDFDKNGYPGE